MKRNLVIAGAVGLVLAAGVTVLGLVMADNASFAKTYTKEQLMQQRITFTPEKGLTAEEKKASCLMEYAGQPLTTGTQAECYANEYIGLHVRSVAGGQTYAELGSAQRGLEARVAEAEKVNDPAVPDLKKQLATVTGKRGSLFQGETSRGLLLTSFGFSELGAKGEQAATAAYVIAVLLGLLSVGGLVAGTRGRRDKAVAPQVHSAKDQSLVSA